MRRHRVAAGVLCAVLAAGGLVAACGSLPKDRLAERLLVLAKNRGMRELGVQRRAVEIDVDGESVPVDVAYVHAPARGPSRSPPLVLVHGTPASLFTWSRLLFDEGGLLDSGESIGGRDVWALDVLGHGLTEADVSTVTFQSCADTVAAFVESLDTAPVDVVGNSYGGEFVWRAVVDRPELFRRMVLMDSSGYEREEGGFLSEEVAMRETWGAHLGYLLNSEERIRRALEPQFQVPVTQDQATEVFLLCENKHNWSAMVDLARDENGDREDDIARVARPTLLIWGADELAYPVETWARRFERDIPGARLEVLSPCGHYPHEERPADVARLLREFLTP